MIKDKNVILSIGALSLVMAILLGRYVDGSPVVDFLEGLGYGLSIVMNSFALYLSRQKS